MDQIKRAEVSKGEDHGLASALGGVQIFQAFDRAAGQPSGRAQTVLKLFECVVQVNLLARSDVSAFSLGAA